MFICIRDIGVLLAKAMVMVNNPTPSVAGAKNELHVARMKIPGLWPKSWKDSHILELGCGVGLTGLVGASLGAKVTLLTDLQEVVEKVTIPNVDLNKGIFGVTQKIVAMPLCWGNEIDELNCRNIFKEHAKSVKGPIKRKTKKGKATKENNIETRDSKSTDPDLILIGDVAYQHKPGAPSHFDILLSTLLNFATTPNTTVVFGTRMRMPASIDLLDMFREHFDEVVDPPVEAHELDMAFHEKNLGRNSLITIHVFKRKVVDS